MGKLVRDLIPEIIQASGRLPETTIVTGHEYIEALKEKLLEEAHEVLDAPSEKVIEEIADVQEVLSALISALKINLQELERVKHSKRLERGGFTAGIILH
ncbi:MAG: phosphoribosyl-ATP pyrophosphohydrolase [Actinobacteria bacterium]|nr:phosphoribosyl-ATP pyrophosphohydrolase [Actinomycetota bacterium]